MRKVRFLLIVGVIISCAAPGAYAAKVMKCNQIFENDSEKRICNSPDLLALDADMAALFERAKPFDKSLSKSDRAFRKARKQCKGNDSCLVDLYNARISELKHVFSNASGIEVYEGDKSTADDLGSSIIVEPKDEENSPRVSDSEARDGMNHFSVDGSVADVRNADESSSVPQPAITTTSRSSSLAPVWQMLGLVPWWVWVGLFLAVSIYVGGEYKRCPRCKKRDGKEISNRVTGEKTRYEDVEVTDKLRNRSGRLTGTTTRTEQRAYTVQSTEHRMRCMNCGNEWFRNTSSRT